MSEDNKETQNRQEVDLSQLSNIEFATAWTPSSSIKKDFGDKKFGSFQRPRRDDSRRDGGSRDFKKRPDFKKDFGDKKFDKSQPRKKFDGDKPRDSSDRKFRRPNKFGDKRKPQTPFNFTMEVLFYPDDTPFNKLADIMKTSKRTYQLFDIAELVLEKSDRFIILAKNLPDETGATKPLYCAQPLNLPFEDETAAKEAALEYYVNELFEKQQIEVEPPKGSFQVVNRCTATGDLLGAPNWHRYNEYLREYHREHCAKMPFEAFLSTIESVRDAEQIGAWLEQMKKRDVYKLKNAAEGENDTFDTREAAVNYLSHKMGNELVKTYEQVRMKGANLAKLPFGRIRRNIEEAWRKQKRFPIVTANNLRGRLRRSGFSVYKRGSKGFAFVSVVKRKFLFEGDKLSDTPQQIFDFITANPATIASDLPYKFLGLTPPETQGKAKTLAEENKEVQSASQGEATESVQPENAAEESTAAKIPEEISDEQKQKLSSIWSELLWLVSEGYVVEYADSTLQANPYLPKPKDKSQKTDEENLGAADEPIVAPKAEKKEDVAETESDESESADEDSEAKPECAENQKDVPDFAPHFEDNEK